MKTKRILFRADAAPSIGTGDLMSFVHLSRYFERVGWECHFMIRDYEAGLTIAEKHRLDRIGVLKRSSTAVRETEFINEYMRKSGIDAVFMQISERPLTDYGNPAPHAVKCCVKFDSLVPDWMDVVVAWDVNAGSLFKDKAGLQATFLLGPRYAILPMEFDQGRIHSRRYRRPPRKVLVTMGGADEIDLTRRVVSALIADNTAQEVRVIAGAGYRNIRPLERLMAGSALKYGIAQNVSDMFAEYMDCDLAISAGGLTLFELVASGTPALVIAACEHQIERCVHYDGTGAIRYLGYRDFGPGKLSEGISRPPVPSANDIGTGMDDIVRSVESHLDRKR